MAKMAREFVRRQTRHPKARSTVTNKFSIEVPPLLDGLDPCFRSENLATARAKDREEDFAHIGVELSEAFDPMSNVVNSKSILFNESNVGSQLIESMTLPRDCHAMFHSRESTADFAEKVCQSLALARQLILLCLVA